MPTILTPIEKYNFLKLDQTTQQAVMSAQLKCPLCDGSNLIPIITVDDAGVKSHDWRNCMCRFSQGYWKVFTNSVPAHFQFVHLRRLEPIELKNLTAAKQRSCIAAMRKNSPDASYAFFGPNGTAKTTYCVALYRQGLLLNMDSYWRNPKHVQGNIGIWRVSAKQLLEDFHKESMHDKRDNGDVIHPVVNREKIEAAKKSGLTPRLFIEEIDKVAYTQFKVNALFELFDALYENDGQMVFNTNLTFEGFISQFVPFGVETASEPLSRRIREQFKVMDFYRSSNG